MNSRVSFLNRKQNIVWISLMVVMTLVLAACQPAAVPTQAAVPVTAPSAVPTVAPTATTAAAAPAAASEVVVNVATDPKLGKILVDGKGMTLYMFTKDEADKSNCAGGCLKAWPPLVTAGSAKAGDGVDQSMLGTATMAGGSKIVTYNHMPLYYWAKDLKPGDTTGQNVNDVWFVVAPDGKPVGMPAAAPAAASNAVVVNVATDAKLGKILVDSKGMTLYMFTKDEPDKSNCAGGCLKAWPPLVAAGDVKAGEGVDQSLLGTASMADGSKIVTYNHMPLYYWAADLKPGDTTGQDVNNVWFVVAPDGKPVGMPANAPAAAPAAANDVVVNVATDAKLGKILVDSKGMTLYMFTKDEPNKSNCAGGCLKAWPPLVAAGNVKAGEGVDQALLGTAAMADGSKIVTYNKMPLYYWAKDLKAGDATGQGVNDVWYVVAPDGKPVGMPGAAPASSSGAAAANDVVINLGTVPALGKVLVDSKGMTLYMFTKDGPDKSNCAGGCLKAWPPLLAAGSVKAGEGVDQSLIGTAAMPDGSKIVTYNKMPLYYYQGDSKPGDVTGQTVNNVWYVVGADGVPVKGESSDGY